MAFPHQHEVVVVGAGIIGCSAARELAPDHDVAVVDKGNVAGSTTGRASGLVTTPASYASHPDLAEYTVSFFREYDGTGNFEFVDRPRLMLVPPEMEESSREVAADSAADGFSTAYRSAPEIEDRYPDVFDLSEYAGAVVFEDTGWVDPYTYATTLQDDAADSGAEFYTGVEVTDVLVEGGSVRGVATEHGEIEADHVVMAMNWQMREVLEGIVDVPVIPFRWQDAQLEPSHELGEDFPMAYDPVSQLYWRPEKNGNLVVGGGEYRVENPGTRTEGITQEFMMKAATEVPKRLRGFSDAEMAGGHTCRTGDSSTPDRYPIMDEPVDAPDGLIVNTGYHIGGVMTAPAAGIATRSLVTGEDCPFDLEPFRLDRFETRGTDFEFVPLMSAHTTLD